MLNSTPTPHSFSSPRLTHSAPSLLYRDEESLNIFSFSSLESSRQIASLEEQLHGLANQREQLSLQVAASQEQCSQYYTQLQNLQLVLEQFQAGKHYLRRLLYKSTVIV